ncbi:MAG: DNA-3-methyladenine glycosylase 2 family protein [Actinobacteria bacterium]|nr:MAG: DNA-3-methyladenine glycosylase 2 family protein [Actinomycetota bacterium]
MAVLAVPQPYDFERSLDRFTFWGVDRANVWQDGGLHRVINGREVRIEAANGGVRVEPFDEAIEPAVRKLIGLEYDLEPFYAFAHGDPVLAEAVRRLPGFRPPLAPDPFEALVSSITAQQVSLHAALAVRSRFIVRFGEPAELAVAFPTRERVARASEEDLRALGFSTRKAEYVLGLARADLDFATLESLPDDEVKRRLTAVRGLGEWSADWFLARHLARPEAWPAGDLGLRKAVLAFYPDVTDVRAASVRFHPFENLSAHYLLAALRYS